MKAKLGATFLAAAFLAVLVFPWPALAGGGGGGRGAGKMGGASIRNQTRMEKPFRTGDMEQFRMRDGGDNLDRTRAQDRDRDRDRIHNASGIGPAATTMESAAGGAGEQAKKGNTHGPGDGTGPYLPKDGTGYGAPENR